MDLFLIITFVIILYWRTMDYYYLIDDIVRRWGYLLEIPETSPPPAFFSQKPQKSRHLFLTLTHCVIVSIIYFLWGWKAALLFAVNPVCVACTAWITGGYYQVTTLLTLTSYFFLINIPGFFGGVIAAIFFTAAINSTVNCIAIPFIFLFLPPLSGICLFWPLSFFLFGRKFRIGFKKRDIGKSDPITWRKLAVVPKVLAYYIKVSVFPFKLGFFREFGFEYGKDKKVKEEIESFNQHFFESLVIIFVFCSVGFYFSPIGLAFYLAGILPFTQWKVLGQFVAERYLYLPTVGWSLILSSCFSHVFLLPVFFIVVALYAYRAHKYIPAHKNIESLYRNGIDNFPKCVSNYVNLAERYLHTGRLYDAYKLLRRGLEIDPNSFLCHANMAAYWLSINQPEAAVRHTKIAMRESGNRGMAYNIFKQQLNGIVKGMAARDMARKQVEKMLIEIKNEENKKELKTCGKL